MATLLVVDDEPDTRTLLTETLSGEGHAVQAVADGPAALDALRKQAFDLALLDIRLPGLSGLELLERVKALAPALPVIMVTGWPDAETAVQALRRGACDYVRRPFELGYLVTAVRQALAGRPPPAPIRVGDLLIDLAARRVWRGEDEVPLTRLEFDLLACLVRRAGQVVAWEELLTQVWRCPPDTGDPEMVRSGVKRLRRKLEADPEQPRYLTTVWGVGYRWEVAPAPGPTGNLTQS